jgi:TonB-dependent starch-binding outer membrane protein SusC
MILLSKLKSATQYWVIICCLAVLTIPLNLYGQGFTVRGKVTDALDGNSLPGVNIIERGTTTGTVTDVDGNYVLEISGPNATLRFTYIGYLEEEIQVNGRNVLNVALSASIAMLSEMVVIGYGVQRKEDLTGSVAVVNVDDLTRMNAVSFDRALQGRAAGVHVSSTSGRPGAEVSIKIRGIGSISRSSEPLFVVDGVALSQGGINTINPNDIESVQVLKDASATAIYGTRGANGVIVVTTKRGEAGKPRLNYSTNFTSSQVPKVYNVMNADQYSQFMRSAWNSYSTRANVPDDRNLYLTVYSEEARRARNNFDTDTDWLGELTRAGLGQNHSLSIRGGTNESNYFVSANYYKEDGIMINTGMDRISIRANSDFQVSERIKIGQSSSVSQINYIYPSHYINFQPWSGVLVASPLMPVYDPTARGGYAGPTDTLTGGNERTNVIAEQMLNENVARVNRILANAYAEVKLIKGMTYTFRIGGEYSDTHTKQWSPEYTLGNMRLRDMDVSRLTETANFGQIWQFGNYLEYTNRFGNHNITGVVGHERMRDFGNGLLAGGFNIPFEDLNVLDQVLTGQRIGGSRGEERLESALFRTLYDYKGKYLVTASIRSDGSSKFAPANRVGYFPSFSVGWRVNDDFFTNVEQIDMLKLRFGWGQTGNSNIPRYQYLELIDPFMHTRYTFGRDQVLYLGGAPITFQSSPLIQWEAAEMTNFGLDLYLFDAKVEFTAEYYIKNQDNMLVQKPISSFFGKRINYGTGWPTVGAWMNLARVQNRGLELNLLYREL